MTTEQTPSILENKHTTFKQFTHQSVSVLVGGQDYKFENEKSGFVKILLYKYSLLLLLPPSLQIHVTRSGTTQTSRSIKKRQNVIHGKQ